MNERKIVDMCQNNRTVERYLLAWWTSSWKRVVWKILGREPQGDFHPCLLTWISWRSIFQPWKPARTCVALSLAAVYGSATMHIGMVHLTSLDPSSASKNSSPESGASSVTSESTSSNTYPSSVKPNKEGFSAKSAGGDLYSGIAGVVNLGIATSIKRINDLYLESEKLSCRLGRFAETLTRGRL